MTLEGLQRGFDWGAPSNDIIAQKSTSSLFGSRSSRFTRRTGVDGCAPTLRRITASAAELVLDNVLVLFFFCFLILGIIWRGQNKRKNVCIFAFIFFLKITWKTAGSKAEDATIFSGSGNDNIYITIKSMAIDAPTHIHYL